MRARTAHFSAVAILVSLCSTSAQADTQVSCIQTFLTGPEFSQCSDSQVNSQTDPNSGVREAVGRGEATADLRTGSLRSRSVGQFQRIGDGGLRADGFSIAELSDTITIGGGYSGIVEIRMDVSGSFLVNVPTATVALNPGVTAYLSATYNDSVDLGTANVFVDMYSSFLLPDLVVEARPSNSAGGSVETDLADPEDLRLSLVAKFAVSPSAPSFSLFARLGSRSSISPGTELGDQLLVSEVDFGNSAQLSLIIPEGVPWTSESGAFLVPEPAAGALAAAGIACLLFFRRLRRS